MAMNTLARDLMSLILQARPQRLLAVGQYACDVCDLLRATTADAIELRRLAHYSGLDDLPTWTADLAVVTGVLETLPKPAGAALIARLRDVQARRLILLLTRDEGGEQTRWTAQELLALGLRHQLSQTDAGRAWTIYSFDIATYKPTPDWLNPAQWAHPERWDKERW